MYTPTAAAAAESLKILASRLREIRVHAGLSAKRLAELAGWHSGTKVSKIEHGKQRPTVLDIQAWCRYCDSVQLESELITSLQAIDSMYVEWRRLQKTGLRQLQEVDIPLYERTKLFQIYEASLIPGLFQTPAYASALLHRIAEFKRAQRRCRASGSDPDGKAASA